MSNRIILILNIFEFERLCDKVDVRSNDDLYLLNDIEEKIFMNRIVYYVFRKFAFNSKLKDFIKYLTII